MIDLGTVANPEPDEAEPVQFTIAYTRKLPAAEGDEPANLVKETAAFTAFGEIPYGVVLAYMAASALRDLAAQGAALVRFLNASLPPAEQERLDVLIDDPQVQIQAATLQTIAARLAIHYTAPRLDPTSAAAGGKPSKSANGRSATQRGSSARRPAKAST